jgi:hypothetical protein
MASNNVKCEGEDIQLADQSTTEHGTIVHNNKEYKNLA